MDWGEDQNSVMLICPERLDPETLGSRIPVIFLLQASAGLSYIGIDPAGVAAAPEVLPGSGECRGGTQGRKEEQGIDSLCFIF